MTALHISDIYPKHSVMKKISFTILLLFNVALAQKQPAATPSDVRLEGYEQRVFLNKASILNGVEFKSIGPTVMSGRVVDLAVDPQDATHFYVAYASGGLWETTNNGTSFNPIFDNEAVMTIGDIAIDWINNIIWIGTGENNSSRSSYSGVGIYKSADNGNTWEHAGLPESHHIGRIVLHPTDGNIAWVAVLGHLYSANNERGVYKTIDGGSTWSQTLFVNDNCGAVDLVLDPNDGNTLYAATWQRERRAWNFTESGEGTGIYKSVDGGNSWNLITTAENGFPVGEGAGRIGLSIGNDGILYACIDNQLRRPEEDETEADGLTKSQLRTMSKEEFVALDEEEIANFLTQNGFPDKYTSGKVIKMVKKDEIQPVALVEFLEDANSLLFDTPVIGQELYVTSNGGVNWQKTHDDYLDDVAFSYGYYFGQVRVNPNRSNEVYIVGVPILKSNDGGATFTTINESNVHVDHHALWINPERDGHLINGNDGGVNVSYDDGETWVKCNSPAVGQFYTVAVDMHQPFNVYGGLQDNGVWIGPSYYKHSYSWYQSGQYPYEMIMGGDGMQVAIDTRDNSIIYTGFQFGNYFRLNRNTGEEVYITPTHELGERPLRFNWQTPIHLSSHNQDILYLGANKLYRSMNQGDSWEAISDDLTKGGKKGDVPYGTLASIHESPMKFGLIYTGSDDGRVHVTKDGGNNWKEITGKLPKDMWVSRIQASAFEQSRVYVALNGYRWDDFSAYLYVSEDYGTTWQQIGTDLPAEPINVVKEDPVNENILYVGTDHGLYISFNKGQTFMQWQGGLPAVSVHDLVVHPTANEIIIATHGRSLYVATVDHVQLIDESYTNSKFPICMEENLEIQHAGYWGSTWSKWLEAYEPEFVIPVYFPEEMVVVVNISSDGGNSLNNYTYSALKGLNYIPYNLEIVPEAIEPFTLEKKDEAASIPNEADNSKYYLPPGEYLITINAEIDSERVGIDVSMTVLEE